MGDLPTSTAPNTVRGTQVLGAEEMKGPAAVCKAHGTQHQRAWALGPLLPLSGYVTSEKSFPWAPCVSSRIKWE